MWGMLPSLATPILASKGGVFALRPPSRIVQERGSVSAMIRSAASKVMWVGRATVFLLGVAVILAMVFGAASTVSAHTGNKGFFHLGHKNVSQAMSTLVKKGAGPALNLKVGSGPPLAVNSSAKVNNLNSDQLDGVDSTQFAQKLDSGMTTLNPSSIPAQTCGHLVIDPPGAGDISNDVVVVTPDSVAAQTNLVFGASRASQNPNAFRIRMCNITAGSIDPPSANYYWMIFHQP